MPKRRRNTKRALPKKPKRLSLPRMLFLAAALLGVTLLALYFYVDTLVARRLKLPLGDQLSALYSEALLLGPGERISARRVERELTRRGYRRRDGGGQLAIGEFAQRGDSLTAFLRPTSDHFGGEHAAEMIALVRRDSDYENQSRKTFHLEPELVAPLGEGSRSLHKPVALGDLPAYLPQAIIAIEDERFYEHWGVDLLGIMRAAFSNIRALRIVQGGSTLSQQLAKNLLFTPRRSLTRKILEALAAISLERRLSKDELLELYLNHVYLGQEGAVAVHGVAAAAETFFSKEAAALTLAESALLAGIIQAPSFHSPRRHLDRALARQRVVLDKMRELQFITAAQRSAARAVRITVQEPKYKTRRAAYFVATLSESLEQEMDFSAAASSGVAVFTGVHPALQECAERAVRGGVENLTKGAARRKPLQAALVALEPWSGKVRAWVGGTNYARNQFDHVSKARRQIGSTIKPFLYLTALDPRLNSYRAATPLSVLPDEPMRFETVSKQTWEPENYDHKYRGDVTLRYALEHSLNLPAVYIAQRVGLNAFHQVVSNFELGEKIPRVPALALGAMDTTLLRLTAAYAALANEGRLVTPRLYTTVRSGASEILRTTFNERIVAGAAPVFVLTDILRGVLRRGTAQGVIRAGYQGDAAGKTGTSNDARDAWFVGYVPALAVGVWLGFDDNSPLGLSGARAAAPIWAEFMQCGADFIDTMKFTAPADVRFVRIDSESGRLATTECSRENVITELFVAGTEPRDPCPFHFGAPLDGRGDRFPPLPTAPRKGGGFWENLFG